MVHRQYARPTSALFNISKLSAPARLAFLFWRCACQYRFCRCLDYYQRAISVPPRANQRKAQNAAKGRMNQHLKTMRCMRLQINGIHLEDVSLCPRRGPALCGRAQDRQRQADHRRRQARHRSAMAVQKRRQSTMIRPPGPAARFPPAALRLPANVGSADTASAPMVHRCRHIAVHAPAKFQINADRHQQQEGRAGAGTPVNNPEWPGGRAIRPTRQPQGDGIEHVAHQAIRQILQGPR